MATTKKSFLDTVYHMRTIEQVIVYMKIPAIPMSEENEVIDFLQSEFEREVLEYPFAAPEFDKKAAIWAAKTAYFAAELLLYRETEPKEIGAILPDFTAAVTPSAILSADLCLRFLPRILDEIRLVDPADVVIPMLEKHLKKFHFSAIGTDFENFEPDFKITIENDCVCQLYTDRIIERKSLKWATLTDIAPFVFAGLGNYPKELWPEGLAYKQTQ